ncbi:MAG: SAM-dependent methyltransferase [Patescibacteria group bacterium]
MKDQISFEESSFRDPSGAVYYKNNKVYRLINKIYKSDFDLFLSSGLKKTLEKKGLILKSKVHDEKDLKSSKIYKVLETQKIPFISYPYEWSFSQLRDAALITLDIQRIALEHGMSLKDASSYNVQFFHGKPVFIDLLSFEKYQDGKPWVAYRQFCQHFLAPLALIVHKDIRLSQILKVYIDGVPLDLASKLLPKKTWLNLSFLMHIHAHAKSQIRYADKADRVKKYRGSISKQALLQILDSLEKQIKKMKWHVGGTEWGDYYSFTNYTKKAFEYKKKLVAGFLKKISPKPELVWDLGANTGEFSKISSDLGLFTVSFDIDPLAVEKNYVRNKNSKNLLPLILDLTNPTSGIGWSNTERKSMISRGPADCAIALALIHHLAITNNIPFSNIAKFLSKITNNLIIEFVPKDDSNAKKLLILREDVFPNYTKEDFEKDFSKYFKILNKKDVRGSKRILYLMKKI